MTKKTLVDQIIPIPKIPQLSQPAKLNPKVVKMIIQGAIQGAYHIPTPSSYDLQYQPDRIKKATKEEIEFVMHLIESLEPANAIEATLAAQYAISFTLGLGKSNDCYGGSQALELFEFSHKVLEALQKYRTKGAQLINVQYNHNQGSIVNIKNVKESEPQITLEAN